MKKRHPCVKVINSLNSGGIFVFDIDGSRKLIFDMDV